jgi:NADP-reducing hydrogenase subunit HndB
VKSAFPEGKQNEKNIKTITDLWRNKMAKLTIDDLKKIKEKTAKETSLRDGPASIKITVHMGT